MGGRVQTTVVGAALAVGLLVGCADDAPAPAPAAGASAPSIPAPAATPAPSPPSTGGGEPMETDLGETAAATPSVWDDAAREQARATAVEVMAAYARPELPHEQWWAQFSAYLSAQAAYDYQWVDPAAIAARAVTGPAELVDDSSVYLARLVVPSDVGDHEVLLSRTDGPTSWRVERITPPETTPGAPAPGARA